MAALMSVPVGEMEPTDEELEALMKLTSSSRALSLRWGLGWARIKQEAGNQWAIDALVAMRAGRTPR